MSTFDISPGDTSYVDIGKGHYDIIFAYDSTSSQQLVCNGGFSPPICFFVDVPLNQVPGPLASALERTNILDIIRGNTSYVESGQGHYNTTLTPRLDDSTSIQGGLCNGKFSSNPCILDGFAVIHVPEFITVPEPMTWALLGIGLIVMLVAMRCIDNGHLRVKKAF